METGVDGLKTLSFIRMSKANFPSQWSNVDISDLAHFIYIYAYLCKERMSAAIAES